MADTDPRFTRLKTDPRFRRLHKKESQVKVDPRFKSLFQEGSLEQASARPSVDKYGRRQKKTRARDQLRRYYRLDDDENETAPAVDLARGTVLMESSDEEEDDKSGIDEELAEEEIVLERRAGVSRKPSVRDVGEIDLDEAAFPELEAQAAAYSAVTEEPLQDLLSGEETSRLAVVNLDWDNVQASDLYKVFSSVASAPASGPSILTERKILNVRVYPSDFGKERLKQEETQGPPTEVFRSQQSGLVRDGEDVIEVDDGAEYDNDALRQYQLDRLRYYYAIVTCDSPATASLIYSELDGTELERTANVLDLRYVPDHMEFDEAPREEAVEDNGLTRALDFQTPALRHSKVKLTWDEDDPKRNRLMRRPLTRKEIDETDFKAYIASSESEEDNDDTGLRRDKLRSLLLGDVDELQTTAGWATDAKRRDDMEVTFLPGLSAVVEDQDSDLEESTLDRYQRKQKQKHTDRKAAKRGKPLESVALLEERDDFFEQEGPIPSQRSDNIDRPSDSVASKDELALILDTDAQGGTQHFDMHAILRAEKAKGKKRRRQGKKDFRPDTRDDAFVLDVADPRFISLHNDTAFALDPSHPKFRKTKGMSSLLEERSILRSIQQPQTESSVVARTAGGPKVQTRGKAEYETEDGGRHSKRRRRL
ncbi:hypothetical protein CALCODRAFT_498029 [Calocera cornea HHB12733]|uniref:Uncharacterized protein n=1 Tax=Calocera cornea HHB12733 TaxID=1353952 RepID=A0A165F104_9BASI|nr:hypothetical protein CALCODRAFT_498029 [Calocera cornea HHB12733]